MFFFVSSFTFAVGYLDSSLLRAKGDIKVYLINNNTKRWVSSIEVFNFNNFKWQDVKVVSVNEVAVIKEGDPLIFESPLPAPTNSVVPAPIINIYPVPPISAKINDKFPAPDYARADWLISYATSNYGRIGQRIIFKYSGKEKDKIENFRLYEKKPGDEYFYKIADFEKVLSTGCEDTDIDGEWMITEAGQCEYWSIQRIILPGGRGMTSYLPPANYIVGEYVYYIAGVDQDGLETAPSPEAKLVFLDTVAILEPINSRQLKGVYPDFKWTIANGWPANSIVDYFIMISDDANARDSLWTKQLRTSLGEAEKQFTYDGFSLNPAKKYKINIFGHYRSSEYDPDYVSISLDVPEFWMGKTGLSSLFRMIFSLILNPFDF